MLTTPEPPINFQNNPAVTDAEQIGLTWEPNPQDGGAEVIDYTIMWDRGIGSYEIYDMYIEGQSYVVTGLTPSSTYSFRISGRNIYGASDFTEEISILSAETPAKPLAPITSQLADQIVVTWVAPSSGGSPITAYRVLIKQYDDLFSQEVVSCDGALEETMNNLQCVIPTTTLNNYPWNIEWGAQVFIKVIAINTYGDSPDSDLSSGTTMITKPDAPIGIIEDLSGRTQTSIAFFWTEGISNGGATVHDFRIYMNADGSDYELIRSGITETIFLIDTLTPGVVYGFKLQARNDFGLSDDSEEFLILCATVPNAPLAPVTTGYLSDVIVSWQAPFNNGSPITSYRIFLQAKDTSYIEESFYCLSNEYMVEHTECVVPLDVLTQEPYNLQLGDSIYAKVIPNNVYGEGQISTGGNGATIVLVPSAPVSLTNDGSVTNA